MSYTNTVTKAVQTPAGIISKSVAYTGTERISIELTIPTATTNQEITIAFTRAQLQSLYIVSDYALTLKTNSTSSPGDTITLQADVPWNWETGGYFSQPLAADVTKIYATNASGSTATLQIEVLLDSTP